MKVLCVEVCFCPQFGVSRGLMNAGVYKSTANYKGGSKVVKISLAG